MVLTVSEKAAKVSQTMGRFFVVNFPLLLFHFHLCKLIVTGLAISVKLGAVVSPIRPNFPMVIRVLCPAVVFCAP